MWFIHAYFIRILFQEITVKPRVIASWFYNINDIYMWLLKYFVFIRNEKQWPSNTVLWYPDINI